MLFGSHTFVPISWMCKKQTSVSHSSTESEIISLDTGLRMDGLPALELWDLIVSVLGNVSHVSDGSGQPESDDHKHHKSHKKIDVVKAIDAVPSNVQSARQEALLYVFEDNEAVIKMNLLEFSRVRATLSSATSSVMEPLPSVRPDSKLSYGRVDQAKPVGVAISQVPVCEHHLHDLVKAQQDIHRWMPPPSIVESS